MRSILNNAYSSWRAGLAALPLLLAARAAANEVYVNPQTGSDSNAGTKAAPLLTLHAAIASLAASGGVVRAMPGIYCDSPSYNNEIFPLNIPSRVALQGVGAKECVIRRINFGSGSHPNVLLPLNPPSPINTDIVFPIVDFSFAFGSQYVDTFIEGFTFQGGQVQIYTYPEAQQAVRISNCVFDLRNGGDESLPGPEFGILLTSVWRATPPDCNDGHYPYLQYHILNNTFVSGYQLTATSADTSIQSCVALANSNDPAAYTTCPDPNPTIRGVSDLNVQNNLFRILPGQVAMATIGIDSTDITAAIGVPPPGTSLPYPTNAFDPAREGVFSADSAQKWASGLDAGKFLGAPVLAIDTIAPPTIDPGFVGEMIGQTQGGLLFPHVRDWRLLQTSPLKDIGTRPAITSPTLTIGATDGINYVESPGARDRAFDWDGEGLGNRRIVDGEIDVGFDEIDQLTIAGSYGSDSKSHGSPYDPKVTPGNIQRTYIKRPTSTLALYTSMTFYLPGKAYDIPPGTTTTGTGPLGLTPWYLANPYNASGPLPWNFVNWTNPVDGTVHVVSQAIVTLNDYGPPWSPPMYLNTQAVVTAFGVQSSSNLQAEVQ